MVWGLVASGVFLALAALAWSLLLFQILPRIDRWRTDLAEQATRALGVPVRIGALVGQRQGIWPQVTLKEVTLLDPAGRPALKLPEISAQLSLTTMSPRALFDGELRLAQLTLVAPELDIRRLADGRVQVAGLSVGGSSEGGPQNNRMVDWLLSQGQVRIAQGTIRWTDELRAAPTLALSQLDLTLRNRPGLGRRHHDLTIQATPPTQFGQRLTIQAEMTQPLWLLSGAPYKVGERVHLWRRWGLSTTRPSQWATWSGTVNVKLPQVDVSQLKRHVSLPVRVDGGRGALQAVVRVDKGLPQGVTLDADVQGVKVTLGRDLAPLAFRRLQGRVDLQHEAARTTIAFSQLGFTLEEGVVWPASSASVVWRHTPWTAAWPADPAKVTLGGAAQADRLDLALLARIVDRLPVPLGWRQALAELAPHGVVEGLSWQWDGVPDAPQRYQLSAQAHGLGWAMSDTHTWPALDRADVSVRATQDGGTAELALRDGWVAFPGVFEEPRIPVSQLQTQLSWQVKSVASAPGGPPDVAIQVRDARFANDDAAGTLEGSWRNATAADIAAGRATARLPGLLTLRGQLDHADATRVWRYLPLTLPPAPRDYVRQALQGGTGEAVSFEVDGDLDRFPFKDDAGGRFRVRVPLKNVVLRYAPGEVTGDGGWPAFTSLEGLLLFEGQRMLIQDARGKLGEVGTGQFSVREVQGRIDDLGAADPHLLIQGQGDGPLNDAWRFLAASPIARWTGQVFSQAQSTGTGSLQLHLDIPLNHADDTHLQGTVSLKDSDQASLQLNPDVPLMTHVAGSVGFTERELTVSARTKVWGRAVTVEGRRDAQGQAAFTANGTVSAEGLRQATEYPVLQRLATRLQGEAPVAVAVTLGGHGAAHSGPEVRITSTLQGLSSDLPAPLAKPAQAVWPLEVIHRGAQGETGNEDALSVEIGNPSTVRMTTVAQPWLQIAYQRDTRAALARVIRGTFSLVQVPAGEAMPPPLAMPTKGVSAQVILPQIDLDAWEAVAKAFGAGTPASDGSAGEPVSALAQQAQESYVPDNVAFRTPLLQVHQRSLKNVEGTLAHPSPDVWRAQVEAPEVAGRLEWAPETGPVANRGGNTRLVARLSRLWIPAAEAQALQAQASAQMLTTQTRTLPALDVVIDDFQWRGISLGRVEVEAVNRLVPVAGGAPLPEWRMTRLVMHAPEAELKASGNWTALGAQRADRGERTGEGLQPRSAFSFTLDLNNSGALLTRLGLAQAIKGGKGSLTGQVSWLGAPLDPDPLTMSGDIHAQISEGQFLKVDPGLAKLLGVLSLQSLPRRLTLDFRDLFQEGFAFDTIDGDIHIGQGLATTRNLRMRGVQAVVLMEGQADLAHETQNLHVYVVPDVNAGGASLAYAAINPVIGIGTFIAQMLLRKQVAEASTREFIITGPWASPQVERVAERSTDTKPSAEAAASAPAASGASAPLTARQTPS